MASRSRLSCSVRITPTEFDFKAQCVVTRPHPQDIEDLQTLVFCCDYDEEYTQVFELLNANTLLEPFFCRQIDLPVPDQALISSSLNAIKRGIRAADYDPATKAVYLATSSAILRLGPDNIVTEVAGMGRTLDPEDGPGPSARFANICRLVSDGKGCLFVGQQEGAVLSAIRKVTLLPAPAPTKAQPPGGASGAPAAAAPQGDAHAHDGAGGGAGDGEAPAPAAGREGAGAAQGAGRHQVTVSTLPLTDPTPYQGMSYDHRGDRLLCATGIDCGSGAVSYSAEGVTVKRMGVIVSEVPTRTNGVPRTFYGKLPTVPVAGSIDGLRYGPCDGRGAAARFSSPRALAAHGDGSILVVDSPDYTTAPEFQFEPGYLNMPTVRRIAPDGTVTTLLRDLDIPQDTPQKPNPVDAAILPNGCLALCCGGELNVLMLGLGPNPWPWRGSGGGGVVAASTGQGHAAAADATGSKVTSAQLTSLRRLAADMGALLAACNDDNPDVAGNTSDTDAAAGGAAAAACSPADVSIAVGDRTFRAHRAVLSLRSEYFRRLFAGEFADSAAPRVSLPDTHAGAFACLLRHAYTGWTDFPPALLHEILQLAERLLLPGAAAAAAAALLAAVTPRTVVSELLWAEGLGGGGGGGGLARLAEGLKEYYLDYAGAVVEADGEEAGGPGALAALAERCPRLMLELHVRAAKRARYG